MHKKRGLSAVVTTLIIVLLVLVSIGIIWGVIQGVISEGSESISLSSFNEDLELQSAKVEGDSLITSVKRNVDGDKSISKVQFIFENGTDSQTIEKKTELSELDVKTFSFYLAELSLKNIDKVFVAPVYLSSSGQEESSRVTDFVELEDSINGTKNDGMFAELGYNGAGTKEYTFSSNNDKLPEFKNAIVDPLDVLPGDIQTFSVTVYSPNNVTNVTSFTELDHGNVTFLFEKISDDGLGTSTWEVSWEVYDVHTETYRTHITAIDSEENENTLTLTWTDSCQSQIVQGASTNTLATSCTVTGVDGADGGDIVIGSSATLTLDNGGIFVWNSGQKIDIDGTISLSGGSLKKGPLYAIDNDGDNYGSGSYTLTGTLRAKDALSNSDCNDGNAYVHTNRAGLSSDNDQDGYTDTGAATRCAGNSGSVGGRTYYRDTGNSLSWLTDSQKLGTSDCDDTTSAKWQYISGYTDADGDGYGEGGTLQPVCSGSSLPSGYASNDDDCYDSDANVYPNNPNYYAMEYIIIDGGSSWDYDCSGSAEKQYTQTGGECRQCETSGSLCNPVFGTGRTGWSGSSPACGSSGTYYTDVGTCPPEGTCVQSGCSSESRTQQCH